MTTQTKEQKLKKEIKVCNDNIRILKAKINENAKGHYDGYTHGELVNAIEQERNKITKKEAELKGIKQGQKTNKENIIKTIIDLMKGTNKDGWIYAPALMNIIKEKK